MSYCLGHTEDNAEVKKVVDEVQGKREWVMWAGKTLMLHLHTQMEMEKADAEWAEQDAMDDLR
jgi:hypothetical protein